MFKLYHNKRNKKSFLYRKSTCFLLEFQCSQHAFRWFYLLDPRVDSEPLEKSRKLFMCQITQVFFFSWPFECACFKAFVQQQESIAFPDEGLDAVASSATEQKDGIWRERIKSKLFFHSRGQTIDAVSEIRISAGDIYFFKSGFTKHGREPPVPF